MRKVDHIFFLLALEIQILLSICTGKEITETHHAHTQHTHATEETKIHLLPSTVARKINSIVTRDSFLSIDAIPFQNLQQDYM